MAQDQSTTAATLQPPKSKRERGGGRVFKRGGVWWLSYYHRGKEVRESARTGDEQEARKRLKNRIKEVGADQIGARTFVGPALERITVSELLDDALADYRRGGKKRIPREVCSEILSALKPVREFFGQMRAVQVRATDVEDFIELLRAKKKKNSTINCSLSLLGRAFRLAVTADPPKPMRALKVPKLDVSDNVRKGKFTPYEADLIFSSLPPYLADVARFAYETGTRKGEITKLKWSYLDGDAIAVPAEDCKNRKKRSISLTPELEAILARRRKVRIEGCELIFHNDGRVINNCYERWNKACVANGLGKFLCPACHDEKDRYISTLDANGVCPRCKVKPESPKYVGKLFHDFRRTACYEMWKSGSSIEDCMKVSGHATAGMFKRYADLFGEEELRERQREVQEQRRAWREAQANKDLLAMPTTTARQ